MKKSELKFKVYTGTKERNRAIAEATDSSHVIDGSTVVYVVDGAICGFVTPSRGVESLPEVTLPQALDLIAQVEPEPDGEFVEFKVDADGRFGAQWHNGSQKTYWPNVAVVECNSDLELVFAGWVWEDGFVTSRRMSVTAEGVLVTCAESRENPAQPIAVRFWRKNK